MTLSSEIGRQRSNVLAAVRAVPSGFVTTYNAIAAAQDLTPRHVRHILADMKAADLEDVPWHRVVGIDGQLDAADLDRFKQQKKALQHEGVVIDDDGRVHDFLGRLIQILAVTRIQTPPGRRNH